MKKNIFRKEFVLVIIILFVGVNIISSMETIKEDKNISNDAGEPFDGYTLFSPIRARRIFLIDNKGKIVHTWEARELQGLAAYLLENGNLVHSCSNGNISNFLGGGFTGYVEILDWNGTLIWDFEYSTQYYRLHNDIKPLPNGNILMTAWEVKTKEEIEKAGCNPDLIQKGGLWTDYIIEVDPTKPDNENIIWEWHVWDHLIQDFDSSKENYGEIIYHPELIDVNYRGLRRLYPYLVTDQVHISSLDYNPEFDQILVNARNYNEIWIIDHNTTKEEAAGHIGGKYGKGGDLLYRWGNPITYDRGNKKDQILFMQHDACWIEKGCPGDGHITIFNNGVGRPGIDYPTVEEIVLPVDESGNYYLEPNSTYGPEKPVWTYKHKFKLLSNAPYVSSAQRLPNGNTLICYGWWRGHFIEVTPEKEIVWRYLNVFPFPIFHLNKVYKVRRYPIDYPGIGSLLKDPK
jgi:hypothetical protein